MADDQIDAIQAVGVLIAICWPMWRGLFRMNSNLERGLGAPSIPNPFRPDSPIEHRFRRVLPYLLIAGALFDSIVLVIPNFPFVKDRRLYSPGILIFGGLAIWHLLYLKGIVKRRTLWPGYVDPNTHENRVKEILVLRAHERGERIPTVEEVREAASMPVDEFKEWLAKT